MRRDDSDDSGDLFRLYEVAGASHVPASPDCQGNGSSFPVEHVLQAAAEHLFAWVEDDVVPPRADRIQLAIEDVVSTAEEDEFGNPIGGVRSSG